LQADFKDLEGLKSWMRKHRRSLDEIDFWLDKDHHLLWTRTMTPTGDDRPRPWTRKDHDVAVRWDSAKPAVGSEVRIIPESSTTARVCDADLQPRGRVTNLPFDPRSAALQAHVAEDNRLRINYFGPAET
jgi:hypothetical protein